MSLGKMYFRAQNKAWYAKVDGKQKMLSHCEGMAKQLYDELSALHATRDPLVCELIAHYLGHTRKRNAASTYDSRKYVLDSFSKLFGHLKAASIKPLHVTQWIDSLGELGDTTIADRMTMLQGCWRYGVNMMLIPRSYIVSLEKPERSKREFYLEQDRWEELLGHLVERVRAIVKERKAGAVLVNTEGNPWSKSAINSAFRRLKERMGEPELCATALRHSFCVGKIRKGVRLEWIVTLLGHTDAKQILSRYGHLFKLTDQLYAAANA